MPSQWNRKAVITWAPGNDRRRRCSHTAPDQSWSQTDMITHWWARRGCRPAAGRTGRSWSGRRRRAATSSPAPDLGSSGGRLLSSGSRSPRAWPAPGEPVPRTESADRSRCSPQTKPSTTINLVPNWPQNAIAVPFTIEKLQCKTLSAQHSARESSPSKATDGNSWNTRNVLFWRSKSNTESVA